MSLSFASSDNQATGRSDSFNHWVAYVLANTILFSPAEEIDSTSIYDVQSVYGRLVEQLNDNWTIGQMILAHENSQ